MATFIIYFEAILTLTFPYQITLINIETTA
jgi:hypothetical protein